MFCSYSFVESQVSLICLSFLSSFLRHGDSSSTFPCTLDSSHLMYQKKGRCRWEMLCVHFYRIPQFMAVGFCRDQTCCSHTEPACHTCSIKVIFCENIFRVSSAHRMSCVLFELSLSGELLCLLTWAGAVTEPLGLRAFVVVVWVRYVDLLWLCFFFFF